MTWPYGDGRFVNPRDIRFSLALPLETFRVEAGPAFRAQNPEPEFMACEPICFRKPCDPFAFAGAEGMPDYDRLIDETGTVMVDEKGDAILW